MARITGRVRAICPPRPDFFFELQLRADGFTVVAGIDEAGRGPLAGPVTAAAVILPGLYAQHPVLHDSKLLHGSQRDAIYREITTDVRVQWACAVVEAAEIDELNILRATHEAMRRAVLALPLRPDHALIDGLPVRPFPIPHTALVKGDARSTSIAAASVIAKVTRDRLMLTHDQTWPQYGFVRHKGYATAAHLASLRTHGPCPIHRRSFAPVAQCFGEFPGSARPEQLGFSGI